MADQTEFERELEKRTPQSKRLFERALKVVPGGVHVHLRYSPPYPFFVVRSEGCKVYDIDGNDYDDYWIGHGAMFLGHGNAKVKEAVLRQIEDGWFHGLTHEKQVELSERIVRMVPHVEKVRFTNTGTEANLFAIRLARAFTGRESIGKFEGGWHGGYDALNVSVRPPWGIPNSAGLTKACLTDTITFPYNDLDAVREKMKGIKEKLACLIVEPFLGAGGFIPPEQGFLEGLREITREQGIILIFDEVISGFRLAPGGAAEYYGVEPDLSTFGKALSNGFPLAAIGGRAEILDLMNPLVTTEPKKRVAHSGTFCANPIAMVAGIATLDQLKDGKYQKMAESVGKRVRANLRTILDGRAHVVGTHCTTAVFFTKKPPKDPADIFIPKNMEKLALINTALLTKNIYFIDGMRGHVLPVHTDEQLDRLFEVTREFVKRGLFD